MNLKTTPTMLLDSAIDGIVDSVLYVSFPILMNDYLSLYFNWSPYSIHFD